MMIAERNIAKIGKLKFVIFIEDIYFLGWKEIKLKKQTQIWKNIGEIYSFQ